MQKGTGRNFWFTDLLPVGMELQMQNHSYVYKYLYSQAPFKQFIVNIQVQLPGFYTQGCEISTEKSSSPSLSPAINHDCPFPRFTSAIMYQGLIMYLGISGSNVYLDFFYSSLVEFPAAFILVLTTERVGRRYPWVAADLLAGVACLVSIFIPERKLIISINTHVNHPNSGQSQGTLAMLLEAQLCDLKQVLTKKSPT